MKKIEGLPKGELTVWKVLDMGFDINVLANDGHSALSLVILSHKTPVYVSQIMDGFLQKGAAEIFNVDLLLKQVSKHLQVFGQVDLDPLVLVQLVKHLRYDDLPEKEMMAFLNFRIFCESF